MCSSDLDVMRQANYMVDRDTDRVSPGEAAHWLEDTVHLASTAHLAK